MGYFIPFAILVCVLATLMTKFALAIKDKARLPDGVVGGILIGAITSIPELITSICVVVQSTTDSQVSASSVFGDVIGSNMFCMLIMSVVLMVTIVLFKHREANQINTVSLAFMVVGTIFCFIACIFDNKGPIYDGATHVSPLVWNGFNFFSIFIFASYAIAVFSMIFGSKVVSAGVTGKGLKTKVKLPAVQKHEPSRLLELPMWSLILLLVGSVVALTLSSLVLAASCGGLIVRWGLPQVFGRTLLLGVATSLPELVAVVNLAINRRYNMVIDSMVGSCAFNMTILFLSNMIYGCIANNPTGDPMFVIVGDHGDTAVQLSLFLLQCLFVVIYLVINSRSVKSYLSNRQAVTINAVLLGLSILPYICYITLGILEQNGIVPYGQMMF